MKKLLALLFFAGQAHAQIIPDDWSQADTAAQVLVTATLVADMGQTLDIKNHPDTHETNKILGKHPSDTKIVAYFVLAAAGHAYVATKLPAGWQRSTWQYGWAAIQIAQVVRNRRMNLRMAF